MQRSIYSTALLFLIILSGCMIPSPKNPQVIINNQSFSVTIAQKNEERARGLSGRKSLNEMEGMLFVFQKEVTPAFWMKDMLIPIDIIWIKDDKVVDIDSNVQPQPEGEELIRYRPDSPVTHVLELKAGSSDTFNITKGSSVKILDK